MLEFKPVRKVGGYESSTTDWAIRYHETEVPTKPAAFALECVMKWGMVQGADGGEDSQGRAKLKLMDVGEVVDRAVEMSETIFAAIRDKGWMVDAGTIEEIEAELFPEEKDS